MVRAREPISISSRARARGPNLRLYVVFTDTDATRAAIETATQWASDLSARLVLLFAKVVPYPLPLDSPPVTGTFTDSVLAQLAAEQEADITVRVFLCRDRDQTIRNALEPGSVVVIGYRKSFWRNSTPPLGRLLKRDGHQVILVHLHHAQPAVRVESSL